MTLTLIQGHFSMILADILNSKETLVDFLETKTGFLSLVCCCQVELAGPRGLDRPAWELRPGRCGSYLCSPGLRGEQMRANRAFNCRIFFSFYLAFGS